MAEDKKDNIGGIPGTYWRYIAVSLVAVVLIYAWNGLFNFGPPQAFVKI